MSEILNPRQAATFLNITLSTLYKYVHKKVVPYYKPRNKNIYFLESELREYVLSNRIPSDSELQEKAEDIVYNEA